MYIRHNGIDLERRCKTSLSEDLWHFLMDVSQAAWSHTPIIKKATMYFIQCLHYYTYDSY